MGANFWHSRAINTEDNSLIWPKFELIREFMAVQATCKFDEDLIKTEGTINRTRSNIGFFSFQGQVTPKWKAWSGQNSNSSENLWLCWLPAILMTIWSKLNALSIGQGQIRAFSALKGKLTLTWIVWCGWKSNSSEILWLTWLSAWLMKIWSKVKLLSSEQLCLHYKSMGKFFIAQGQVTPKKIVWSGPK